MEFSLISLSLDVSLSYLDKYLFIELICSLTLFICLKFDHVGAFYLIGKTSIIELD